MLLPQTKEIAITISNPQMGHSRAQDLCIGMKMEARLVFGLLATVPVTVHPRLSFSICWALLLLVGCTDAPTKVVAFDQVYHKGFRHCSCPKAQARPPQASIYASPVRVLILFGLLCKSAIRSQLLQNLPQICFS